MIIYLLLEGAYVPDGVVFVVEIPSPTLSVLLFWDHMDRSLPGSYGHGISQARKLAWAAISFSRASSQHRG